MIPSTMSTASLYIRLALACIPILIPSKEPLLIATEMQA